MERRERVVEVGAKIARLRAELVDAESELDLLISGKEPSRAPLNGQAGKDPHGTAEQRAEKILKRLREPMTISEIHAKMPDVELPTLRSALVRMVGYSDAVVQRSSWGKYQYKEQTEETTG